ncbi:hypothetical protein BJP36_42475 [Moorena producens JHB]|uniref:Uncharacterized protein n=1 Tax=Moorena producens (strain JHB) TaxID=1454205 RepID=A0A9Q9SSV6_MOOP1|nr:hypothetical protein [Moorena producens]WAN69026.1 hypothetical protein BJP36_42475 [Moorena producens JHB]
MQEVYCFSSSHFRLPSSVREAWPTASVPAPCSEVPAPYKPKTLYLTEVQTAVADS